MRSVRRLVLVVAATLLLPQSLPGSAAPADSTPADLEGVLTPQRMHTADFGGWMTASDAYVLHEHGQQTVDAPRELMVLRTADGSVARELVETESVRSLRWQVHGDHVVRFTESSHSSGRDAYEVLDPETGRSTSLSFRESTIVSHGDGWLLTCQVGSSSGHCAPRLRTISGVDVEVPLDLEAAAQDVDTAVSTDAVTVRDNRNVWWDVDLTTGEVAPGTEPGTWRVGDRTFHRVIGQGDEPNTLVWSDRNGARVGSVAVQAPNHERDFVPYGDGAALVMATADGPIGGQDVRPIDLATGEVLAPVVSRVSGYASTPSGRLVVGTADTVGGRIAVVSPGDVRTLMAFAERHRFAATVDQYGDRLHGRWEDGSAAVQNYFLAAGEWSTQFGPGVAAPAEVKDRSGVITFTDDVLVTQVARQEYRITWPSGSRTLASPSSWPVLSRGGEVVVANSRRDGRTYAQVQDTRSGEVLLERSQGSEIAVDGRWIWTIDGTTAKGANGTAQRSVTLPTECIDSLRVMDRWLAVSCADGTTYVADTREEFPGRSFPVSSTRLTLGSGFVVIRETRGSRTSGLRVSDLTGRAESRTYGPAHQSWAVDRAGGRVLSYVDARGAIRQVDVSWSGTVADPPDGAGEADPGPGPEPEPSPPPPARDVTAPKVTTARTDLAVQTIPGGKATFRFGASDDVAVASYEVQRRTGDRGKALGAWAAVSAWRSLTSTSVSATVGAGRTACFRVRARDAAGNTSAWSNGTACTLSALDDRHLTLRGGGKKVANRSAIATTETRLSKRHASLRSPAETGRVVRVTGWCGTKEGAVSVKIGSRSFGKASFTCAKPAKVTRTLTVTKSATGPLTLTATSAKRVRIDTVSVQR